MKKLFVIFCLLCYTHSFAQIVVKSEKNPAWKKVYRAEATKINDLVNTKLDVRFDFDRSWMYGQEWLTLKPHFYPTDSLTLDAKAMDIKEVSLFDNGKKTALKYAYDSLNLYITLNKTYKADENYTIYINYIARPEEYKGVGSAAITDAKGLYFINPKGEEKNKPTEIWTQGETESNSVWMPTIDKPNQKSTEEITMTVPDKYVTLSNGLLVNQKKNTDGTRTDTWKMDLPHAPYLFFMGIGEYSIIKDSYKGKEVSYYVEKEYAPVARKIFGNTPEMIKFYSQVLGIDFPWQKYAQIVGRDYVSGAMENTTATLHEENAYQNERELLDGNAWEEVIAHELFHQWFGDLVTTESWSNITVNESFADFSETLWDEYKYGKDKGDEHNYEAQEQYLNSGDDDLDLVRFYYRDKEDMFDDVSYAKGGRILNMLRNYVGDSAFFKSLNKYLTDNKFKTGEAQKLRLAFEEVTGQDLNWFWNQWYYGSGHPVLKIDYDYDDANGKASVIIQQTQKDKVFKLPFAIDVYNGANKKRYNVWMNDKTDTFTFNYTTRPDLINVDADKILLCEKTDNKTTKNFETQIKYAPLYLDRREALTYFAENKISNDLQLGLTDKYAGIRSYTLDLFGEDSTLLADDNNLQAIENVAKTDADKKVKAKALSALTATGDSKYKSLFLMNVNDSSYSVAGAALAGFNNIEPDSALAYAKKFDSNSKGLLKSACSNIIMQNGTDADFDFIVQRYEEMRPGQDKFETTFSFCEYLLRIDDATKIKKGIDEVIKFRNEVSEGDRTFTDPIIKDMLTKIGYEKGHDIAMYVKESLK